MKKSTYVASKFSKKMVSNHIEKWKTKYLTGEIIS